MNRILCYNITKMKKGSKLNKDGFWKGKNRSEETKEKIRITLLNKSIYPEVKKICSFCGKEYKGQAKSFCSYECKSKSQLKLKDLTCSICGKWTKIKRSRINATTCSLKCKYSERALELLGNKNHLWKGGITPINLKIRTSKEYKLWRKSVFERDNYTCVWCNKKGDIEADHIKPFSLFPKLRFSLKNGRTLCVQCHKTTDTYGTKIYNYEKQIKSKTKNN